MENLNVFWLLTSTLVFLSLNILLHLMRRYFKEKPLGSQTLFDVILIDDFCVAQFSGSVITLNSIVTRFEAVKDLIGGVPIFVTLVCSLYTSAFIAICVHGSCVCIVRTLCLVNMSFLEETLGESVIRLSTIHFLWRQLKKAWLFCDNKYYF